MNPFNVSIPTAAAAIVLAAALGAGAGFWGGTTWADRGHTTAEAVRTASLAEQREKSAIDSQKLLGELYEDLKRQSPAVAGYQRDILFVCSGVQPVFEAATGSDTAVPAGTGSLQREITASQRAEFAAVVAADIGNCADAIPKRNSGADWIVANGG